jgi:hypothetical protein
VHKVDEYSGDVMDHQDGDTRLPEVLQREPFGYFRHETNPANGLVRDKTCEGWPASIAAAGLAPTAYPVGVERAFLTREEVVKRTLTTLRFFTHSPRGPEPNATGYNGITESIWGR